MLDNNWNIVEIFERKIAQYCGFRYAITTDCCTNAVLISLELLKNKNVISKEDILPLTKYTYLSIPMTLQNNGWKITFIDDRWHAKYQIGSTCVFDAATDFKQNMSSEYSGDSLVCVSFQQKKRLALGRGGAVLTNNKAYAQLLKRMRYDGRNPKITDSIEIANDTIINGYHCYMEPDKAAKGILVMNQLSLLPKYKQYTWKDYNDISLLKIWKH